MNSNGADGADGADASHPAWKMANAAAQSMHLLITAATHDDERCKRKAKKNAAMCLDLHKAIAMVPALMPDPAEMVEAEAGAGVQAPSATLPMQTMAAMRYLPMALSSRASPPSMMEVAAAASAATASAAIFPLGGTGAKPPPPLVLLAVVSTGVCYSSDTTAAGTGYRTEQLLSLGETSISLVYELSIRSSFQIRGPVKAGASIRGASNPNRLVIQEASDLLIQGVPGMVVVTVAANASLTKPHYPYLRLAQRAGGPLLAQQACGSVGESVVTHRLVFGPAETDVANVLHITAPTPYCKHGRTDEHDDCRRVSTYNMKQGVMVPDGRGGWAELNTRQFNLDILGEKFAKKRIGRTNRDGNTEPRRQKLEK